MNDKSKYKDIDDYIDRQPEAAKLKLTELRAIIKRAVPAATETINYELPAFALIEGGKRDKQIMFAAYKNHVGFYPTPAVIEHFSEELKNYKCSKGAVQFSNDEPLPEKLIAEMCVYKKKLSEA